MGTARIGLRIFLLWIPIVSPWYIRKRLVLSQPQFANTSGILVATLQNGEQHPVMMTATIALILILAA